MDGVNQDTLSSCVGSKLAFSEGFQHIEDVHAEGDELDPRGIDLGVGIYYSMSPLSADSSKGMSEHTTMD